MNSFSIARSSRSVFHRFDHGGAQFGDAAALFAGRRQYLRMGGAMRPRLRLYLGRRLGKLAGLHLVGLGQHQAIADSRGVKHRSEEHTSELQSLMRISYAVFCLKKKNKTAKI